MTQYYLYKRSDPANAFVVVNENTIDSSHTSVYLVGQRKEAYGQPEQQSKVWMLENFANNAPPANPMLGQEWYNITDSKMYVCTDKDIPTFIKVGSPIVASSTPSGSYLSAGDLWYNTSDGIVYVYNGTTWSLSTGPGSGIPSSILQNVYFTVQTTDATATDMWLSGVDGGANSNGLSVPAKTTWNLNIQLTGKTNSATAEVIGLNFKALVVRDASNTPQFVGGIQKEILGISSTYANTVDASISTDANNLLKITVVGQASTTINWTAVASIVATTTSL